MDRSQLVIRAIAFLLSGVTYAAAADVASTTNMHAISPSTISIITESPDQDGWLIADFDRVALQSAANSLGGLTLRQVQLAPNVTVDLELTRFHITTNATQFVIGRQNGPDVPYQFDPSSVTLLRGAVPGYPGSHVFLSIHESLTYGVIDLGPGAGRYVMTDAGSNARHAGATVVSIRPANVVSTPRGGVPQCGNDLGSVDVGIALPNMPDAPSAGSPRGLVQNPGPKRIRLAVETDYEFFDLFTTLDEAAAYLVFCYGAVSDIYQRDVNVRLELVFARLWDNPDDLFNNVDPSPLPAFRSFWNNNMQAVQRDVAQLLSGRSDYPFGGQGYLNALCGGIAYSVCGYATGLFVDPSMPDPYHYDIYVAAHELGHNCGTVHTHDLGIDDCVDLQSTPRRGSIMSYCSQTWSGQNAVGELYFHTICVNRMLNHINSVNCPIDDCNFNGIDDSIDAGTTSPDVNGNDIPDECEDCDNDGILNDAEITAGSADLNLNGVPDECETDCNGNGVPDDLDIANQTSSDAYGDRIPDDCEADCNNNGVSDYTDIQMNMALDIDRNAILDQCQDCDSDGTNDLDELNGSHSLWIASGQTDSVLRRFYGRVGVENGTSSANPSDLIQRANDLIISPSNTILVTSADEKKVMQFDLSGVYLGDFVATGVGGLDAPTGLTYGPDGNLYVGSSGTNNVLRYNGSTGAFIDVFATGGGLAGPFGLTFGPNGNLFVTSSTNEVVEFNGATGAFVRIFVSAASNGGLDQPRGLTFKPDGNLLVCSYGSDQTLEYDGQTGAPRGQWAFVGTNDDLTQDSPWGIRVGPNGNVFVVRTGSAFSSGGGGGHDHDHDDFDDIVVDDDHDHDDLHLTNAQIYEFNARSGKFIRTHIGGNDHGLAFPTGFDFIPGWDVDCNLNYLPDSCDIASGFSTDANGNGRPDECEVDCNGNGEFDRLDIIPFGTERDCNANLIPDSCELASGAALDCNGNGIPDACDVFVGGSSSDCNANGVPDECEYPACQADPEITAGDFNCDHDIDLDDLPGFVSALLLGNDLCHTDMNNDGAADGRDITGFANCVLGGCP